jgi:cytochrome b561
LPPERERHPRDVVVRYTRTAIALHWLIALVIFAQIPLGWYLDEIPTGTPARSWYVNLHKSVGMTLGVVIVFRTVWRWFHKPPAPPDWMPRWQRIGASATHVALYACMLIMPFTGYVASNFSKWGVKYFNTIQLPAWGVDDERIYAFFNGAHVATSYVFLALIFAHTASALRHARRHDGIVQRMGLTRRGQVAETEAGRERAS